MNVSVDPQIAIAIENVIDLEPIQNLVDSFAAQGLSQAQAARQAVAVQAQAAREGLEIQSLVALKGIVAVREQAEVTRQLGAEFGDLATDFLRSNRVILLVAVGVGVLLVMRKGK